MGTARTSPPSEASRHVVLAFAGTRPEVLKLYPVLLAARGSERLDLRLCFSGQQGDLAKGIAAELGIHPDHELPHEGRPKTLSHSLSRHLGALDAMVEEVAPEGIIVQGDTTTAVAGAITAFYRQLPCFHVEAGLRTPDPYRPFPEEMNRRLISRLSTVHLVPTEIARRNLLSEGYADTAIFVTGNTIVDTLRMFGVKDRREHEAGSPARVVVTLHRRENAEVVDNVVAAVKVLSARSDVEIIWVAHPNATGKAAAAALSALPHVRLVPPYGYKDFVALIASARAVLTDSGGVQEEAPVLGVPVVVLRRETDRPEAISAGNAELAGTDTDAIVRACSKLLDDPHEHERRSRVTSPFGDGRAGERICALVEAYLGAAATPE